MFYLATWQNHLKINMRMFIIVKTPPCYLNKIILDVMLKLATWWLSLPILTRGTEPRNWGLIRKPFKGGSHPFLEPTLIPARWDRLAASSPCAQYEFVCDLNVVNMCVPTYSCQHAAQRVCLDAHFPPRNALIVVFIPRYQHLHTKEFSVTGETAPSLQHSCPGWP